MAYEGTAARKRPQTFDELVGQEFVTATLASSLSQGRIAHAYLFAGPRGVGKTSAARILAKALNCEQGPTATPCGSCGSCKEIARGAALDVIEIDGASNTSVNDVREIRDEVLFAPNSSRYKVYIIDEVHMLSNSAFNALLKTIEEPPPYIVFVFATTEIHKVPATIRSRCQQYNFRLISAEEIARKLQEAAREIEVQAEEKALAWIAKEATGSLRDAYTLFDQVVSFSQGRISLEGIREKIGVLGIDELNQCAGILASGDSRRALEYVDGMLAKGISIEQFVAELAEYFRSLLFLKHGVVKDSLLGFARGDLDQAVLQTFSDYQLEKALEMLLSLYRNLRYSLNARFELDLVISRLCQLDRLISPTDVLDALARLRQETAPGPRVAESVASPTSAIAEKPQSAAELVKGIADAFRREKPALSSSLDRVVSCELNGNELILRFLTRDRFASERVLNEKEAVVERAQQLLSGPVRLKLESIASPEAPAAPDPGVETLKRVFRGEIVKGE